MDAIKSLPQTPAQVRDKPTSGKKVGAKAEVYQSETVREVRAQATHVNHTKTPSERRGLRRLSDTLDNAQNLRRDVPRGYYLNIVV